MSNLAPRLRLLFFATLTVVFVAVGCGGDEEPTGNDDNQIDQNDNQGDNDNQDDNDSQGDNDNQDDNDDDCPDPCTEGETRCSGGELETCVSVDDCPTWADPTECEGDRVCSGGECVEDCQDACQEGETDCDGDDGVRSCEMQDSGCLDWSSTQPCDDAETCEDGVCQACDDGDTRCTDGGEAVEECDDGQWESTDTCPVDCEDGDCVDDADCQPGDYRCTGDVVEICNSTGTGYLYDSTCNTDCQDGQCVGGCTPGDQRCNGDDLEVCNDDGTAWEIDDPCDTTCDDTIYECAAEELTISSDTTESGPIVVDGPVTVESGATLSTTASSSGLDIRATSITVEEGAAIDVAAIGDHPDGQGADGQECSCGWNCTARSGGTGGSYATAGDDTYCADAAPAFHDEDYRYVHEGSAGGDARDGTDGGLGGGYLWMTAGDIDIAGTIDASGEDTTVTNDSCSFIDGSGGGSGGGVALAADDLSVSGSIDATGGDGEWCSDEDNVGSGGMGVVKLLYGGDYDLSGTVSGVTNETWMPPFEISSTTHPDEQLYYNDDFDDVAIAWQDPFPSVDGYYQRLTDSASALPDQSNASFNSDESTVFDRDEFVDGDNYFHLVSVDPQGNVGTVASRFNVDINTEPPTVSSDSHSSQTTWYDNDAVHLEWSDPRDDESLTGYYYTVDQYGDTVPTDDDTFKPIDEKQELLADQDDGVWAFHLVSIDTMDYLTRESATYVFRIGDDPGTGNVYGQVDDTDGDVVEDAALTINRGLFEEVDDQWTDDNGNYNFGNTVPAGDWELQVSADGYETETVDIDLDDDQEQQLDVTLTAE